MSPPEYRWRQLTAVQRAELLAWRRIHGHPWHSPPHCGDLGSEHFHITASCFEHHHYIGASPARMDDFTHDLLVVLTVEDCRPLAWCVLPNHYHALIKTADILGVLRSLGRLHGRTSHAWNGQDDARGRKVFFRAMERAMRSDRHFWATLNYVHHNPVHHGYVDRWTDWPWSSAADFLAHTDPEEARRLWCAYPLDDYGAGWDDPAL
jgi:putative transposase